MCVDDTVPISDIDGFPSMRYQPKEGIEAMDVQVVQFLLAPMQYSLHNCSLNLNAKEEMLLIVWIPGWGRSFWQWRQRRDDRCDN